jgi:aminoglycoside phosphotransferase family enzyme/predicted kinase
MATIEHRAPPSGHELAAALARPEAYAGQPHEVKVRETHISWVFLAGDRAYKLKKPVALPFVDYGTPARRRAMCEEEVRLNRRLAPDVYLGIRAVVATAAGGVALAPAGDPEAIDHVVEMRRFDEARTLAALVSRGHVSRRALTEVGRRLAEFHATAAVPDAGHTTAALHAALAENADTLLALAPDRDFAQRATAVARFAEAFFAARRAELEARAGAGRVRDGHGDLRAEHVLLEHGVEVVDCLEFDSALRVADVGCDLAFLAMDLEALGAPGAARAMLDGYRAAGGDPGDNDLVAFFAGYRALVRAKVALVRAEQSGDPSRSDARALLALAERLAWRARRPGLVVVAGLSATGKTRLASALATRSGLRHLNSDPVRKRLLGIAPAARAGAAAYGESFNRRTYEELGRLARRELECAGGVLVDATFRRTADRAAFLASLGGLPAASLVVECHAPLSVRLERARRRLGDEAAVSDADADVVRLQAEDGGLADDVPADRHVVLRTDRPAVEALDDLAALIDARLARGGPVVLRSMARFRPDGRSLART